MKKIDELVKRVEYFERLAVYGDRSTFLKRLAQEFTPPRADSNVPWEGGSSQGPAANPVQTVKETVISVPKQISPSVQRALNDLLVPTGDIFVLKEDGELGKNTQDAINKFKTKFSRELAGQPASARNILAVRDKLKNQNSAVAKQPSFNAPIGDTKSSGIGEHAGQETFVPGPKV